MPNPDTPSPPPKQVPPVNSMAAVNPPPDIDSNQNPRPPPQQPAAQPPDFVKPPPRKKKKKKKKAKREAKKAPPARQAVAAAVAAEVPLYTIQKSNDEWRKYYAQRTGIDETRLRKLYNGSRVVYGLTLDQVRQLVALKSGERKKQRKRFRDSNGKKRVRAGAKKPKKAEQRSFSERSDLESIPGEPDLDDEPFYDDVMLQQRARSMSLQANRDRSMSAISLRAGQGAPARGQSVQFTDVGKVPADVARSMAARQRATILRPRRRRQPAGYYDEQSVGETRSRPPAYIPANMSLGDETEFADSVASASAPPPPRAPAGPATMENFLELHQTYSDRLDNASSNQVEQMLRDLERFRPVLREEFDGHVKNLTDRLEELGDRDDQKRPEAETQETQEPQQPAPLSKEQLRIAMFRYFLHNERGSDKKKREMAYRGALFEQYSMQQIKDILKSNFLNTNLPKMLAGKLTPADAKLYFIGRLVRKNVSPPEDDGVRRRRSPEAFALPPRRKPPARQARAIDYKGEAKAVLDKMLDEVVEGQRIRGEAKESLDDLLKRVTRLVKRREKRAARKAQAMQEKEKEEVLDEAVREENIRQEAKESLDDLLRRVTRLVKRREKKAARREAQAMLEKDVNQVVSDMVDKVVAQEEQGNKRIRSVVKDVVDGMIDDVEDMDIEREQGIRQEASGVLNRMVDQVVEQDEQRQQVRNAQIRQEASEVLSRTIDQALEYNNWMAGNFDEADQEVDEGGLPDDATEFFPSASPVGLDADDDSGFILVDDSDEEGGLDEDEYVPPEDELAEVSAREARFQQAFLGNDFTMDTRYTRPENVGAGQEMVFDADGDMPIGIRNVRPIPRAMRQSSASFDEVPGGYVNPNVKSFYYQQSFMFKTKKSWASENVPWLFGPEGLYPDIYDCPSDCEDDPLCIC